MLNCLMYVPILSVLFECNSLIFVKVGSELTKGDYLASVESVKAASDVYAPVSGEVVDVNIPLQDAPEKINSSAMSSGWFCKVKMSDSSELDDLLDSKGYEAVCKAAEDGSA